jgi:hypothetical protein
MGERFGLLTRTAMTEGTLLCPLTKSSLRFSNSKRPVALEANWLDTLARLFQDMNKEKGIEISKVVSGEEVEPLASATTAGPAPAGDVVATVYTAKDGSGNLYVEPLPPQSLTCVKPLGEPGCPVARIWYGYANITPQQQADAEFLYRSPDLDSNYALVVGHLTTVEVRDHRDPGGTITSQQTWFMLNKLYLAPWRPDVLFGSHSTQFFYATGTTSNAQVLAISRGEQSPRAARIT